MITQYDSSILLVNPLAQHAPGNTFSETADLIHQRVPSVAGVMLNTPNGVSWQGHLSDSGSKEVAGITRIQEWVDTFVVEGLKMHVREVPRFKQTSAAAKGLSTFNATASSSMAEAPDTVSTTRTSSPSCQTNECSV